MERTLQTELESHLQEYLDVRLLASEYGTGRMHGGRIDSLGIDQENRPVIIEYKRNENANVMNQVLSYLGWLLDHKDEFRQLAASALGREGINRIAWNKIRLVCIASNFSKHDVHAARLMGRRIELIRYRRFRDSLLLLEWIDEEWLVPISVKSRNRSNKDLPSFEKQLQLQPDLQLWFERLRDYALSLGSEVWIKQRRYGVDFRTGQAKEWINLATVDVDRDGKLELWTEDNGVTVATERDIELAKTLILRSFKNV